MKRHVTLLGALFIAMHAMALFAMLIVLIIFNSLGTVKEVTDELPNEAVPIFVQLIIYTTLLLYSIPGIIAGIGLLLRANWARYLGLVVGFINLLNIPIGTIIGVYAIWVLMKEETEKEFRAT
jgi:ABC-type Fe3+ transport system permease subunit